MPIVRLTLSPGFDPEGLVSQGAEAACFTAVAKKRGKKVEFYQALYALPRGCPQEGTLPKYGLDMVAIPKLAAKAAMKAEYRQNLSVNEAARLLSQGYDVIYRVGSRTGANRYANLACPKHGQHYACTNLNAVAVVNITSSRIDVMDPVRGYTSYAPPELETALRSQVFDHEAVVFPPQ